MGGESIGVFLSSEATGGKFSITVPGLALPELPAWGASSVTVIGGGTKCFLSLVMSDEGEFYEEGEEEKDATLLLVLYEKKQELEQTYAATMATAKQAVLSLHEVRSDGSLVKPPCLLGTVLSTAGFPSPRGVRTKPLQESPCLVA